MSSTSPNPNAKVSEERPVHPATIALLRHVRDAADRRGTDFVVAGATARDIVLWHVHGVRAERATRDIDVAVCAISWEAHGDLVGELEATGLFKADSKAQQTLVFRDPADGWALPLDLVPFGDLEAPAGSIAWPPKGDFVMNVLGFREAVDHAIAIDLGDNLAVPVVTLPALTLLKVLAWHDRRTRKNTDASDLLLVLRSYFRAANEERIWEAAADLLVEYGYNVDLAASALLGREARQIALPATLDAVTAILADEASYETLRRDMLARAAAQLLDDFADASDKTLAAFRHGFLATSAR
ncbi:nucleotidyl transferase AbiEii/AbiGii toxin family protein [Paraburkholderia lacunae]|uniref:Nucleotidyltransferase n=1 Tax=Paraburkholderia lacunae TaxID=2211104 RepID=A0A370N0D7_9BURK|nr:nucleotidyl transferase AbiEii/AbiGii toxin family protein [Paraburkholderia lacunae]RDJ99075.1 nucleotidyltransferase [Paraburkholderia lacunae]